MRGGSIEYGEGGPNLSSIEVNVGQALQDDRWLGLDLSWHLWVATELWQRSASIPVHHGQSAPGEAREMKMSSAALLVQITCGRSNGSQRRSPTKALPGIPSQSDQIGM